MATGKENYFSLYFGSIILLLGLLNFLTNYMTVQTVLLDSVDLVATRRLKSVIYLQRLSPCPYVSFALLQLAAAAARAHDIDIICRSRALIIDKQEEVK